MTAATRPARKEPSPRDLFCFASCPRGAAPALVTELRELGARSVRTLGTGAQFAADLETAYRACLWLRTASRVLWPLAQVRAGSADALYGAVRDLPWEDHLTADGTLAVDFQGTGPGIVHTHFGALKVKDAIVDRFRDATGQRPSVDIHTPDVRLHVRLHRGRAQIYLDLSGGSLHRRGYRADLRHAAPLKENLAAAMLLQAGWPALAGQGKVLLDPMCGTGTLLVEAALMAADKAPGLIRQALGGAHWGFSGWRGHRADLWARLVADAEQRAAARPAPEAPCIRGWDRDEAAVQAARTALDRAGVTDWVRVEQRDLLQTEPASTPMAPSGLLISNPPYGQRLGTEATLVALYAALGQRLQTDFAGWHVALLSGNPSLQTRIARQPQAVHTMHNGPLTCQLLTFDPCPTQHYPAAAGTASMFANRLRKNLRTLGRWARRAEIHCYRLYDADMPEYAVAVDLYDLEDDGLHAVVQEYSPPAKVDPMAAQARLTEVLAVVPDVLGIPPEHVVLKTRRRQDPKRQYDRQAKEGRFQTVREGPCRFLVNLTDYLDTGLFLDHRVLRERIRAEAAGQRLLNLFAYTGTATVHAALGGARSTTSVDLSPVYLDWARNNMALNGIHSKQHEWVRADCLEWLQSRRGHRARYDLIVVDPPTFSNSKRASDFDLQRHYLPLLRGALALLAPAGTLYFSTHYRGFRPDWQGLGGWQVTDISADTLPRDFARNPRIRRCWHITKGA